jgi:phosphoglycolate phosphatase-like HAD superfamily hydrolase
MELLFQLFAAWPACPLLNWPTEPEHQLQAWDEVWQWKHDRHLAQQALPGVRMLHELWKKAGWHWGHYPS